MPPPVQHLRPFSTDSIISPHAALEALASPEDPMPPVPHASSSRHSNGYANGRPASGWPSGAEPQEDAEGEMPQRLFVRARFDFDASDPSALSFRAGDLIEVITMLESGWWDGMLGETRGWFPSNFVEEVDVDEEEALGEEGYEGEDALRMFGGVGAEAALGMDDVLGGEWGQGAQGLDDLARHMMDEAARADDGRDFEAAAARVRARTVETVVEEEAPEAGMEADEFGVPSSHQGQDNAVTIRAGAANAQQDRVSKKVEPEDAWIPSLTPDGQVYYHNTQTGEDSWELPLSTPLDEDFYGGQSEDYFHTFTGFASSSSAFGLNPPTASDDGGFRAPPKAQGDIPYPWVARLSDDGREWFYLNRLTGQNQREFPTASAELTSSGPDVDITAQLGDLSLSMVDPAVRHSLDLQRKAVKEWERRTREDLQEILLTKPLPTMGSLMDNVSDALREIFEAAVAGSAAEEEMSRAADLGSEVGITAALLREESAVGMLAVAHTSTLRAIRALLRAFGYVGPIEKMEEMPRPNWTGDMTLIGSIGVLSSNVHAAVTSKRVPESGLSTWAEVMRAASKLRDVVGMFPQAALSGTAAGGMDSAQGQALVASLGVDTLGDFAGGRWGFSKDAPGRPFDHAVVLEGQRIKDEFDTAAGQDGADILDVLRSAALFRTTIASCDIAAVIDLDGDRAEAGGNRVKEEDQRRYAELVNQARYALRDLDDATFGIDAASAAMFTDLAAADAQSSERLSASISAAITAFATLLVVVQEQASLVDSSSIKGAIGMRSPRAPKPRPQSTVSSHSRGSRGSRRSALETKRQKVRGLEDEFLDAEDLEVEQLERIARPGSPAWSNPPVSAAATVSQPSMARMGGAGPSAASSTTSLAYQKTESDSGSTKGSNRTSFMKAFMRGRSGSDADDMRGTTRGGKAPNRKLAKILGEDVSAISLATVPAPIPVSAAAPIIQETPWYLSEDFASEDIVFDDRGGVKAGTIDALVARLTPHGSTDTSFFQAFMLTFRSFTSGDELLDLLFQRYSIPPPQGLTEVQMADWKKQKQTPIRLRVSNVLRAWLDVHFMEAQDAHILSLIEEFAKTTLLANGSETLSKTLLNLVRRRRQGEGDGPRRIVSGGMLSPPAPLIPRVPAGRELRLTDIAPIELARQLTIFEFTNFQRIKPVECLHKAWNEDDEEKAPNVRKVIHTANKLAGWVSLLVLQPRDAKQRATVMKYFIQTAAELKNMNNFSSMAGIVAGLNAAPVDRLKRTKELLSSKTLVLKEELDRTMDSSKNFLNYKEALKTINPPCVPFFGFYLSALTFIEDGNKDYVLPPSAPSAGGVTPSVSSSSLASVARGGAPSSTPSGNNTNGTAPAGMLINFFKRSLSAEILRDIQQYQSQPYNLARCRSVYEFLLDGMERVEQSGDLYERSLILEPREREEERITRMLHDSVRNRQINRFEAGLTMAMF